MIAFKMRLPVRASARPAVDTHTHMHTRAHTHTKTTFCDWVKEAIEGFSQVKEHFLINDDEP